MTTLGVILAAGRGSRMQNLTESKPKCLLELAGKPLLRWQMEALRGAGIRELLVVRGYLGQMLEPHALPWAGNFSTVENPRWAQTNMVRTLLCAFEQGEQADFLISYADIVYKTEHVRTLLACGGDICLTYDTQWQALWRLRQENPLDDAETFCQRDGRLLDIGGKPHSLGEVGGQYMGLLKMTPLGRTRIAEFIRSLPEEQIDKLDMTSLLRGLLAEGVEIYTVGVHGGWCECDTQQDIQRYEQQLNAPHWTHDWR